MAIWLIFILAVIDPFVFFFFNGINVYRLIIIELLVLVVIPLIFIKILSEFGFISDIRLSKQEDRTSAYILVAVMYWVNYQMLMRFRAPKVLLLAILGMLIIIASLALINWKFKISAHAAGVGGLVGLLYAYCLHDSRYIVFLLAAIVIAGVISTARLYLDAHSNKELVAGTVLGVVVMLTVYTLNVLPNL